MSTNTQAAQSMWARLRSGPTASLTHATRWRWFEAAWAVLLVALFGTTGRLVDLLVAIGLVGAWVILPAIGVVLAGYLAVIALGILPPAGWALIATVLVLTYPLIVEIVLHAPNRTVTGQSTGIILGFTAITTGGLWIALPVAQLNGVIGGLYIVGIAWLSVRSATRESATDAAQHSTPAADTPGDTTRDRTEQHATDETDSQRDI